MSDQVTRGDLPHWYKPGHAHFVTYRVANSLPVSLIRQLRAEKQRLLKAPTPAGMSPDENRARTHKLIFAKYDSLLDRHSGWLPLQNADVAGIIRENLYHHHQDKYELIAYCIMPNHVHLVLQPFESALVTCDKMEVDAGMETADGPSVLSGIMHSLKSYTANKANAILGRTGQFWQKESFDHWVRDTEELERVIAYVIGNPVKAGLCERVEEWPYSSAYDRYQLDGSTCGLVSWLRDDWRR